MIFCKGYCLFLFEYTKLFLFFYALCTFSSVFLTYHIKSLQIIYRFGGLILTVLIYNCIRKYLCLLFTIYDKILKSNKLFATPPSSNQLFKFCFYLISLLYIPIIIFFHLYPTILSSLYFLLKTTNITISIPIAIAATIHAIRTPIHSVKSPSKFIIKNPARL